MKLKNSYLLMLLLAFLAFSSCNNDDDEAKPENNSRVSIEGGINSGLSGAFFSMDSEGTSGFFRSYVFSSTPQYYTYNTDRGFWLPVGPAGTSTDAVVVNLFYPSASGVGSLVSGTYSKNNLGPFSEIEVSYFRFPDMTDPQSYEKGYYNLLDSTVNDFELTVRETESTIKITLSCEMLDVDDFAEEPTIYPLTLTYDGEIRRP